MMAWVVLLGSSIIWGHLTGFTASSGACVSTGLSARVSQVAEGDPSSSRDVRRTRRHPKADPNARDDGTSPTPHRRVLNQGNPSNRRTHPTAAPPAPESHHGRPGEAPHCSTATRRAQTPASLERGSTPRTAPPSARGRRPSGTTRTAPATEERLLPTVPSLGDVVRFPWDDDARESRHAITLPHPTCRVNN